jgi:hypothetical protein
MNKQESLPTGQAGAKVIVQKVLKKHYNKFSKDLYLK